MDQVPPVDKVSAEMEAFKKLSPADQVSRLVEYDRECVADFANRGGARTYE